jgi:23S rRNA (cytidine1920-2'-O)/16S rRNA (cytidine1409-2'-O)-methyltransferase
MKMRLDKLVVDRAIAPSRERAQALILAGRILVNEQKQTKPGYSVTGDEALRMLGEEQRYVSRGGLKLEAALAHWSIALDGLACLDVGASTGGFTDCMLQHGAASVLAIDTGYGQIAQSLRSDPRVFLLERTNARKLEPGALQARSQLPLQASSQNQSQTGAQVESLAELAFLAMDVSFISATLVLPPVLAAAPHLREAVVLVKPQFEAGREHVGKGGIVRDPAAHRLAIERVRTCALQYGALATDLIDSPITGTEGNREFLLHLSLRLRLRSKSR